MPDSAVPITPGAGTNIDTFTQADGDHRQAVVIGDSTAATVAAVTAYGLQTSRADYAATGTITAADTGTTNISASPGNFNIYTGTATAAAHVAIALDGRGTVAVQVTGTFVATLLFERSIDGGVTWTASTLIGPDHRHYAVATNVGIWHASASATTHFRVRCTSYTSGTASVRLVAGSGNSNVQVTGGNTNITGQTGNGSLTRVEVGTADPALTAAGMVVRPIDRGSATATRTSVAASTTEAQLLAANTARNELLAHNFSTTATLYLGLGATTVTATNATVAIPPGGYYEAPSVWRGVVRGLWSAADGTAVLTEVSA